MGEPARIPTDVETPPVHDQRAISRSVRYHRARRAARIERRREQRWARLRFWVGLGLLVMAVLVIAVLILQQVQNIFGV